VLPIIVVVEISLQLHQAYLLSTPIIKGWWFHAWSWQFFTAIHKWRGWSDTLWAMLKGYDCTHCHVTLNCCHWDFSATS
jgi:hypothetical protein